MPDSLVFERIIPFSPSMLPSASTLGFYFVYTQCPFHPIFHSLSRSSFLARHLSSSLKKKKLLSPSNSYHGRYHTFDQQFFSKPKPKADNAHRTLQILSLNNMDRSAIAFRFFPYLALEMPPSEHGETLHALYASGEEHVLGAVF